MLTGEVQIAEHLGGETFVYVSLPGGDSITVEIKGQAKVRPGERIGIGMDPGAWHVFTADEKVLPR
jgi:multiple sugar transport system ATP-binding protein